MQTEIEVKFLETDHDEIRAKLVSLGAHLEQPMRLMRRTLFDHADERFEARRARLRVRDEGDKITVTYKSGSSSQYSQEIETTIGSYETMIELFKAIDLEEGSYQESKRETWQLGDVEVVLDEWPWLKPYIEIEGPTEDGIKLVSEQLGFGWSDAYYGSVDTAYMHQYPKMTDDDTVGSIKCLTFDGELPAWLAERQ